MNSGEEIAEWILSLISHVYDVPGCYARTKSELTGTLHMLHYTWSYAVGRAEEYVGSSHPAIGKKRRESFYTQIQDLAGLRAIVTEWRAFDRRFGVPLPQLGNVPAVSNTTLCHLPPPALAGTPFLHAVQPGASSSRSGKLRDRTRSRLSDDELKGKPGQARWPLDE
jgi:hypothetical protein